MGHKTLTLSCSILITILLVSAKENCCKSKNVGVYSYTLVSTPPNVPSECTSSCAYTRDDEPGSLYCFKSGALPATCNIEEPAQPNPNLMERILQEIKETKAKITSTEMKVNKNQEMIEIIFHSQRK